MKKKKREIDDFLYSSGVNYYYIQLLIVSLPTQPSHSKFNELETFRQETFFKSVQVVQQVCLCG